MEVIVIEIPKNFQEDALFVKYSPKGKEATEFLNWRVKTVKYVKSKQQKREHARLYRREYLKRPKVQEKMKAKAEDEEAKKKKEAYSKKPEVIERKKELAKKKRKMNRLLKELKPDVYEQLLQEVENAHPKVYENGVLLPREDVIQDMTEYLDGSATK